jgi:hypothetical protein
MKNKSRGFNKKLDIISDYNLSTNSTYEKIKIITTTKNKDSINKKFYINGCFSETNLNQIPILKNPLKRSIIEFDKSKFQLNQKVKNKKNNSQEHNHLYKFNNKFHNRSKTKIENIRINNYKNYTKLMNQGKKISNDYLPYISNSNIYKKINITNPNKNNENEENESKKNINMFKESNKIRLIVSKQIRNYNNIMQIYTQTNREIQSRNKYLNNNITNKIKERKPIIIKNNNFIKIDNNDEDISFIEEINDLFQNVDTKKKDIKINKKIIFENCSNNVDNSTEIKPDFNQIKNNTTDSRPSTSYGNIDVRKNNLIKLNQALK